MTARYAENTAVPSDRSKAEIENTLRRYGATAFASGWDETSATVAFQIEDRHVRFHLPMPSPNDKRFTHTETGKARTSATAREAAYEQAVRQSWRALALVIKAKLEAVAAGITTVEQEFLAHIVLPNGSTVGDWVRPQLAIAYEGNQMPALLPGVAR